jgi:BirA family biotin operon repressor/biotin-[acetyl-CoA-carboxylase] ligase
LNGWPQGFGLARYDEIDSTNAEAKRLAASGEAGPLWLIAARQTAGRGRRGRVWDSGEGNLAATLLLRPGKPDVAQLSFAAALAVSDMARDFAPDADIAVKWPNDVLADGEKLAGILLESESDWLAIGIGVNLAVHPSDTEFPATSLAALGVPAPAPEAALGVVATRFAHWYDLWMMNGFEPLRDAWLARAGGLGGPIRARLPHEERSGLFVGLDSNGALLLNEQGQIRAITAGEVFF